MHSSHPGRLLCCQALRASRSRAALDGVASAEALVAQEPALLGADVGALLAEVRLTTCSVRDHVHGL